VKKKNQINDSVSTSGLIYDTKEEAQPTPVVVEVDAPAVVVVETKEEPVVDVVEEVVVEKKVEPKKASKKAVEDDDVVPLSSITKATETSKE
jgi:hypothetical protein